MHTQNNTWLQRKAARLDIRLTRFENQDLADEIRQVQTQAMAFEDHDSANLDDRLDDLILRQHNIHGIVDAWYACAPTSVTVVVSSDAPDIVRFAASELLRYMEHLFGTRPQIASPDEVTSAEQPLILLGTPGDQAWINFICESPLAPDDDAIPSPQGYCIDSQVDPFRMAIIGSEPVGVLYGVYEVIERWGVRFQITEDMFPDDPGDCLLPVLHLVQKPFLTERGLANILNMDCVEHSEAEFIALLDHMAKLRYNLLTIGFFYRTAPEVSFVYRGLGVPPEACADRQAMLNRVFAHAHRRGIRAAVACYLQHLQGTGDPGAPDGIYRPCIEGLREAFPDWSDKPDADWRDVTDPLRHDIERSRFRQLVEAYPGVDYVIYFTLEVAHPLDHPDCLSLPEQYQDTFDWEPDSLQTRGFGGHNGRLMELHLLREAFLKDEALRQSVSPTRLVFMACFMDRYLPLVDALLPNDMVCMGHTAYATWPLTDTIDDLEHMGKTGAYERWVWDCLGYDMIQDFPQAAAWANWIMMQKAAHYDVTGIPLNYWRLAGYEHLARYFSETTWNPTLTPTVFYRSYVSWAFGAEGEGITKMMQAFQILEDHTRRLMSPWSELVGLKQGGLHLSPHWPQIRETGGADVEMPDYVAEPYSPASGEALRQARVLILQARSSAAEWGKQRMTRFVETELDRPLADSLVVKECGDRMTACRAEWDTGKLTPEEAGTVMDRLYEDGVARLSRNPWWSTHHRYLHELVTRLKLR